jgi:hypothetical protein
MVPLRTREQEEVDRTHLPKYGQPKPNYAAMTPAELSHAGVDIMIRFTKAGGYLYFGVEQAQQALELGRALEAAAAGGWGGQQAQQVAAWRLCLACMTLALGVAD